MYSWAATWFAKPRPGSTDFPEELLLCLEHAILSHHGKREFGAPVAPATLEALIVSFVDDLDAKVNMVAQKVMDSAERRGIHGKSLRAREPEVLPRACRDGSGEPVSLEAIRSPNRRCVAFGIAGDVNKTQAGLAAPARGG